MNRMIIFAAASVLAVSLAACDREDRDQAVGETAAAIVDARQGVQEAAAETQETVAETAAAVKEGAAQAGAEVRQAGSQLKEAATAPLPPPRVPSTTTTTTPTTAPAPAVPPPVAVAAQGAVPEAFTRCNTCHGPNALPANPGPSLNGVFGRAIASVAGYAYSDGLRTKGEGQRWTEANLEAYLAAPRDWAPGTKMRTGVADAAQRAQVIQYLKTL